jgi:hypothetical protein
LLLSKDKGITVGTIICCPEGEGIAGPIVVKGPNGT